MNRGPALLDAPALEVAPALLGWRLSHLTAAGLVCIELTEVEAYGGESDPASHAGRGRTPRNAVMYGPAGYLYVYFSYGVHWCANVVCGPNGEAAAVLLRAGRVVEGAELARRRRTLLTPTESLARGPGCLTQALGIGREHNGAELVTGHPESADDVLRLTPPLKGSDRRVFSGPRVGVTREPDRRWRFWVDGDPSVSTYRRSPRAPRV